GGVGQVVLALLAQHLLAADLGRRQPEDQVRALQQLEIAGDRGRGGTQLRGAGLDGQHSPGVEAEIDEKLFELVDLPDAEESYHVAFQNSLDDVLTEDALAVVRLVAQGRLVKSADQEVALELRQEAAEAGSQVRQIGLGLLKQI